MAKSKTAKPDESELLKKVNALLNSCQDNLNRCNKLGQCHLNVDEETSQCKEQIAILQQIKRILYPNDL